MPEHEVMKGFPPTAGNRVNLDNWRLPPFNTWGLHHVREVMPTASVPNNPDDVRELGSAEIIDDSFSYPHGDEIFTISRMIEHTQTDGLIVLHKGKVVLEEYRNGMNPSTQHILFSVSKSVTALVAGILVGRGQLNPGAPISDYVPEIANSAYGDATVRHLLDMTVGIAFDEDYTAIEGLIVQYREACGWNSKKLIADSVHLRSFIASITKNEMQHGMQFRYKSPNTDLLGWVIERASGTRFVDLLSECIWKPMGAGHEAYMTIDSIGAPRTAGGLCATLRDMARLGQLVLDGGARDGVQIIPADWIADIRTNGDRDQWLAGDFAAYYTDWPFRYRNKWYIRGRGDAPLMGIGIYGQFLYVDPANDLVASLFCSQPDPVSMDKELSFMRCVEAIGKVLGENREQTFPDLL